LQGLAAERGFAPETLARAYAIKQDYTDQLVQAVGRMFDDPQRNPQPLRDLAAEMDARLASVLDANTVKHLDRLGVLPRLVIQDDGQRRSYSLSRGGFE
jgi:cell division protein ZapA (FtsZ GTPase activity inhibitor)